MRNNEGVGVAANAALQLSHQQPRLSTATIDTQDTTKALNGRETNIVSLEDDEGELEDSFDRLGRQRSQGYKKTPEDYAREYEFSKLDMMVESYSAALQKTRHSLLRWKLISLLQLIMNIAFITVTFLVVTGNL